MNSERIQFSTNLASWKVAIIGKRSAVVRSSRGCEAAANGCNTPVAGFSRTRVKEDNHKVSRGESHRKLGPRRILTALSRTIIVLAGKMKMNPMKRLPIKCPMIGDAPGIMSEVRTSPSVIIVAARLMSGERSVKLFAFAIMLIRNRVTTSLATIGAAMDGETGRAMLAPAFGVAVYTIETAVGFFTFNAPVSV